MKRQYTMVDLPEPLLGEIIKRITRASDLNSLSLVSKKLYTLEAEHRDAIRVGRGLNNPTIEALKSLFSRFSNLCKVEINYSGWTPSHGEQLNNHGIYVLLSHCPLLSDLTLSFCSNIDNSALAYLSRCTKLRSLSLVSTPTISWRGLSLVAVGCKHLSVLHLVDCIAISTEEWLVYLGRYGSLEELVVKDCKQISQYDLLKFGPADQLPEVARLWLLRSEGWLRPPAPYYHAMEVTAAWLVPPLRLHGLVPWVVIGRSCVRVEDRSSGRTPPAPGSIGDTVNIDFLSDQHDDDHERTLNIKIREGKILGNKTRIMNSCDFGRNIQGATRVLLVRLK